VAIWVGKKADLRDVNMVVNSVVMLVAKRVAIWVVKMVEKRDNWLE